MPYGTVDPAFHNYPSDDFMGDGVRTVFTLSTNVYGAHTILVWQAGIKLSLSAYAVNGNMLTIYVPPPVGVRVEVFYLNVLNQNPFAPGVTSVGFITTLSGFSVSGSPITDSGTITLGGTLNVPGGGTGLTTVGAGAVVIGLGSGSPNALGTVPPQVAGTALVSTGIGMPPTWQPIVNQATGGSTGLTFTTNTGNIALQGTLNVANGGTGTTSLTQNAVLAAGATPNPQVVSIPPAAAGLGLVSTGLNSLPTWQTIAVVDSNFGIGAIILGAFPAGTNAAPGTSVTATLTVYGLGNQGPITLMGGTYLVVGAINTTEEALVVRTA